MTILELYYLDAGLAFDPNYCDTITFTFPNTYTCGSGSYALGSNTFLSRTYQGPFMNDVGQGSNCSPPVHAAGGTSTGHCYYATAIINAHGAH